jgi:hypothetical protein
VFTLPRDSIIVELESINREWAVAYEVQKAAADTLRFANRSLRGAVDSLSTAVAAALASQPDHRWYVPRLGVGGFAGVCANGPCTGVGLTVSFDVDLLGLIGRLF